MRTPSAYSNSPNERAASKGIPAEAGPSWAGSAEFSRRKDGHDIVEIEASERRDSSLTQFRRKFSQACALRVQARHGSVRA